MMTADLHLVVVCWVAPGIETGPTRRPVDGHHHITRSPDQHLSARPLSLATAVGGTSAEVDSGVIGGGHDAELSGSQRAFTFLVHSPVAVDGEVHRAGHPSRRADSQEV